jgi:hypothetical protein
MPSGRNLKTLLRLCAESGLAGEAIDRLMAQPPPAREWMLNDWPLWARDDQLAPHADWRVWLLLGGRGAGKTRILALAEKFETGRIGARDAIRVLGAGLRGGGNDVGDDEVARLVSPRGAPGYVEIVMRLLTATFAPESGRE